MLRKQQQEQLQQQMRPQQLFRPQLHKEEKEEEKEESKPQESHYLHFGIKPIFMGFLFKLGFEFKIVTI